MKNKLLAIAVALRSSTVNTLQVHLKRNIGKRARAVIEELKSKGITVFGATGYCYGARLVFDLAFENIIRVSVITHPSFLTAKDLDTNPAVAAAKEGSFKATVEWFINYAIRLFGFREVQSVAVGHAALHVTRRFVDPEGSNFDLFKWLPTHTAKHTGKRVRTVIEELKSKGITVFGATGYCYGARLVFDLAFENIIRVAVITHPSLLTTEDLDIYVEKSKAPLLLNSCEHDELFPPALALTTDEKFSNFEPGYKRTYWEGVHHGFATRGDLKNPVVTAAKKGAFKVIVEWFINHMQ
ncbi:hypothetical protein EDB86DRAFT_2829106 [Lactarius hatsudake]|nr:hypothetical protein EDB86DRAFT_2829106 [Lactarius hatsudake]